MRINLFDGVEGWSLGIGGWEGTSSSYVRSMLDREVKKVGRVAIHDVEVGAYRN